LWLAGLAEGDSLELALNAVRKEDLTGNVEFGIMQIMTKQPELKQCMEKSLLTIDTLSAFHTGFNVREAERNWQEV
jgi:hypothetical protein